MHSGGSDFDVLSIAEQTAEKPFCHRAAADISGTNKENAFHESKPARCRLPEPKIKQNQVNAPGGYQGAAIFNRRPTKTAVSNRRSLKGGNSFSPPQAMRRLG